MWKLERYKLFLELPNCFVCSYQDKQVDIWIDSRKIILELGCGSGSYAIELAKLNPNTLVIWVDMRSDRLCFGAKKSIEQDIKNIKFVWAQVDHIERFIPANSVDEIWITFPDPWPTRDRQKLTSPKYINIYKNILKKWSIIHIKTDDKWFFDYSINTLQENDFKLREKIRDIYNQSAINDVLNIKTYYESKWLKEGRKIGYIQWYIQ